VTLEARKRADQARAGRVVSLGLLGVLLIATAVLTTVSERAPKLVCGRQLVGPTLEVQGDFDGDGRLDRAYEDGFPLVLGICLADGRSDEVEIGQAEGSFRVADLDRDGRDEIIYGGTSVSQSIDVLAAVVDGQLQVGSESDPALFSGPLGDDIHGGQAWGCGDTTRNGSREIIQVTVRQHEARATWKKESYRVEHARLVPLSTTSGEGPAIGDPTDQALSLVPSC
jgi:hypothetical protein